MWLGSHNSLPNGHTHKCRKTQPHAASQVDSSQRYLTPLGLESEASLPMVVATPCTDSDHSPPPTPTVDIITPFYR